MKLTSGKSLVAKGLLLATIATLAIAILGAKAVAQQTIRYGITPYQDSGLPVVPAMKGWYQEEGLKIELVPLAWGDVVTALSSGAIDVAIYNFNSFLAPYENASQRSPKPVFYAPVFVFKGEAIMVHPDKGLQTVSAAGPAPDQQRSPMIAKVAAQLKGKRICVTKGTELEQIVLAALAKANLSQSDATIIYAAPEDCLAAFIARSVDAFAAGLTERVEARRHGAIELLTTSDVMMPVIDGLVTTDEFATKNQVALDKLVQIWFKTIRYIAEDVPSNSKEIREYLRTTASTRYSPEEYAIAWTFDIFPRNAAEANALFNQERSKFYWKKSWEDVGQFLVEHHQAKSIPPYSAYLGDRVLGRLAKTQ
jgi:ABC-type nitrate/sulfonate/bicarbonate transport system substrate-binding protein